MGGSYRIQIKDPMGEMHSVRGVYREICKPERLAFTWEWDKGVGCVEESGAMVEMLVTVLFGSKKTAPNCS